MVHFFCQTLKTGISYKVVLQVEACHRKEEEKSAKPFYSYLTIMFAFAVAVSSILYY